MPKDSTSHTLKVAIGVCLVCSVLVSGAVVGLKQKQQANQELDRLKSVLMAANLYTNDAEVQAIYARHFQPRWVDLEQGRLLTQAEADALHLKGFNLKQLADDPQLSRPLSAETDRARILRQPRYMLIYLVKSQEKIDQIVLPIYGKGLWSTMYGLIALAEDCSTVRGLVFFEHGETPGLGGEIDNPRWRQGWVGKQVYDNAGNLSLKVIKGKVDTAQPQAIHQVDGLSGATLTTQGVDNMVQFWLGANGYGKLLQNWRSQGGIHE